MPAQLPDRAALRPALSPHTIIPYIGIASYLAPIAAILRRRPASVPLRLIAVYCAVAFLESCIMGYIGSRGITNLWLIHLFTPFEATVFLWAFGRWQLRQASHTFIYALIPLFLVAWTGFAFRAESFSAFPKYVKSIECILLVAVAAFTLVTRSQSLVAPITHHDWFWVSVGTLIYFSFLSVLNPLSNQLLPHSRQLVLIMFDVNATLGAVANLLFARAMLCQQPQHSSGGFSSSQPSLA